MNETQRRQKKGNNKDLTEISEIKKKRKKKRNRKKTMKPKFDCQ